MSTYSNNEERGRRNRHFGLWSGAVGVLLIFFAQSVHAQLAPPPGTVRIESIEAIGTGCPPGSFVDSISGDQLAFTLAYSEYTAEDGPGIPRLEARKNCNIILDITYPVGWTFAIFAVDFRGFADLESNTEGTVAAQYFFQGQFSRPKKIHKNVSYSVGKYWDMVSVDGKGLEEDIMIHKHETWPRNKMKAVGKEFARQADSNERLI